MYLEYYNLKEKPFSLTPDPAFLYYSDAHRRAVAFLKYGLEESKGFLQLTGPVGSGKTTLLRAILAQLDERTRTAYIINPSAPFPDLLRSIMKDLEIPNIPPTRLKMELLDFFHDYLLVQMRRSNPVIVIFDEAQNLSLKNLEEIRMLSNFETSTEKLIQIVFVGQPELIPTLDRPELRQLKQRIQVRYHLSSLTLPEVGAYIDHRLRVAGSNGEIVFTQDAYEAIHDFSKGIPRLINSVCDIVLLIGYVNERKRFDRTSVEEAIREMNGSFDDEPAQPEEKSSSSAAPGSDTKTQPSEHIEAKPLDVSSPPVDTGTQTRPHAPTGPSSETVVKHKGVEPNPQIRPAGSTTSVTEVEPKPSPDAVDSIEAREESGDIRQAAGAFEATPDQPPCSPPDGDSVDASQGQMSGFLHSLLRHSATRRFRVTTSPAARRWEPERTVRERLSEIIRKWAPGRNGTFVYAAERKAQRFSGNPSETGITRDSQPTGSNSDGGANQLASQTGPAWAKDVKKTRSRRSKSKAKRKRLRRRTPNGRRISRRGGQPVGPSVERNVVVLFEDGRVARGATRNINLKTPGFHFSPADGRGSGKEEFVPFERVITVRMADSFENDWGGTKDVADNQPKGQQIIVTLANGEIIDGITLSKFDPDCQRFFVVCTDDDGEVCWTLVERTGVAGILTENFKEGIYAEEFETFARVTEIAETSPEPVCQHESAGDFYFSLNDYDSALSEYQKALTSASDEKRLAAKISVVHFNRGVKYLRGNRFHEAKKEFEKVIASRHHRDKARARIEKIERLLKS